MQILSKDSHAQLRLNKTEQRTLEKAENIAKWIFRNSDEPVWAYEAIVALRSNVNSETGVYDLSVPFPDKPF